MTIFRILKRQHLLSNSLTPKGIRKACEIQVPLPLPLSLRGPQIAAPPPASRAPPPPLWFLFGSQTLQKVSKNSPGKVFGGFFDILGGRRRLF